MTKPQLMLHCSKTLCPTHLEYLLLIKLATWAGLQIQYWKSCLRTPFHRYLFRTFSTNLQKRTVWGYPGKPVIGILKSTGFTTAFIGTGGMQLSLQTTVSMNSWWTGKYLKMVSCMSLLLLSIVPEMRVVTGLCKRIRWYQRERWKPRISPSLQKWCTGIPQLLSGRYQKKSLLRRFRWKKSPKLRPNRSVTACPNWWRRDLSLKKTKPQCWVEA